MAMQANVSLLPALASVFDEINQPLLVADRAGRVLYANPEARLLIGTDAQRKGTLSTFVHETFDADLEDILRCLEDGNSSVRVECRSANGQVPVRVRWLPKSDWLLMQMYPVAGDAVQPALLGEETASPVREITRADRTDSAVELLDATEDDATCEPVGDGLYFLAASPAMKKIRKQIHRIATVSVPVLISGESGSGKEVVARMIHAHCVNRSGPFVKVNCAALPAELLESELFGYEQGAFTGAVRAKPGKFEQADNGTIFLDEIAEMSTHLQSKLLHILQDGRFSRLGSRHMTQVNVRVVAATNVDVMEAIRQGRFREDLYYRLNVVGCHLPPLRERTEEIPRLFHLFLDRYRKEFDKNIAEPSERLVEAAMRYRWPGNVRELENFVKRFVILGDEEESRCELLNGMTVDQRPPELPSSEQAAGPRNLKSLVRGLKDEAEERAIAEALRQTNWRRKDAARLLGISYKALLYKMRQFGFNPSSSRPVHPGVM